MCFLCGHKLTRHISAVDVESDFVRRICFEDECECGSVLDEVPDAA